MRLSALLPILADPTRQRVLALLAGRTLCVCDLEAGLGIKQSNLSRHLHRLRRAGLVVDAKRGLFVYYRRNPPAELDQAPALTAIYADIDADPAFGEDRLRLAAYLGAKAERACAAEPGEEV